MTTEEFISRANEIHNGKYDYSKVDYLNNKTKVCIICPIHGEFWQTPDKHLNRKHGCPLCGGKIPYTTESFKEKIKPILDEEYDDSELVYKNNKTKVKLICRHKDSEGNEHGEFWISPGHLLYGQGCPKCRYIKSANSKRRSLSEVIAECRKTHGDKYDYSMIKEYKSDVIKYPIKCNKCGNIFYQNMSNHLYFQEGCPKCSYEERGIKRRKTTEDFVSKAIEKYGTEKYGFEETVYVRNNDKVKIHCNTCGKDFYITPSNFLLGQGCSYCKQSHLEREIERELEDRNIEYTYEKKFDWLGRQSLDFYLPKYNTAIECQGSQHFLKDHLFESLDILKGRDKKKNILCRKNGVKLLYYSNLHIKYPYFVYEDKEELFNEILK
jgi:hypothetical protein